ncbi:MAG TPA: hypothetical protein VIW46_09250 [Acidimicrobiia bacterium]|jgi:hypothetical protein
MPQHRRRLDRVLDPDYLEGLERLSLDELRELRSTAVEVENELSYYRRLLYGRMDLVKFEQRRRSGEEHRSLIDSLVDILTDSEREDRTEPRGTRHIVTDLPPLPEVGKRDIDEVMGDGVLTRLDKATADELQASLDGFEKMVMEINTQRIAAQGVIDSLSDVIAERFKAEVSAPGDD